MEIDAAREFVREHHDAVLLTNRKDGSAQMSPVTCAVDADGLIAISTRQTAVKTKNIRRDPRVSLCVLSDGFYGRWVQIDGTAEIVPLPEAMDPLVEYYRSLRGEHDDWDDYRAAMERDQRLVLRITIERAGPDVSG
ncbi:MAG TPA: PPOX class F420-dependent oxidoreductase [Acidimicrobiia bacterium]|nr:PPOX class F420-dependent oxidoreductase [Acidimicrobiia bacterium]